MNGAAAGGVPRVAVIGRPGIARDALRCLVDTWPDVLVVGSFDGLDLFEGGPGGLDSVDAAILVLPIEAGVSVIGGREVAGWVLHQRAAVQAVTLDRDAGPDDLLQLVRLVATDGLPVPIGAPALDPLGSLTAKEVEVLALVGLGWSDCAVAASLDISPHTVRTHLGHVLAKLGVHSRLEAASIARCVGLSSTRLLASV